jgi:hypothetical protein
MFSWTPNRERHLFGLSPYGPLLTQRVAAARGIVVKQYTTMPQSNGKRRSTNRTGLLQSMAEPNLIEGV